MICFQIELISYGFQIDINVPYLLKNVFQNWWASEMSPSSTGLFYSFKRINVTSNGKVPCKNFLLPPLFNERKVKILTDCSVSHRHYDNCLFSLDVSTFSEKTHYACGFEYFKVVNVVYGLLMKCLSLPH